MSKLTRLIPFFIATILIFQFKILATNYGSDTAVSIIGTSDIPASTNNIINTFGCAKNGFNFASSATTCTFNSIFPVSGPIQLKGGTLYLKNDLILSNTSTFLDLGTINGANHVVDLSPYNTSFYAGSNVTGRLVLNTAAQTTASPRAIRSFDWSYDGKYLATVCSAGSGNELNIFEFTGTSLITRVGATRSARPTTVRWHPGTYHLVLGQSNGTVASYLYTPPSTLTAGGTAADSGVQAVAFQKRGSYLAVGGTSSTIKVYSFSTTGAGSLSLVSTSTNSLGGTVQYDALVWAPVGNKNNIIAITNNTTTGNLHLYNFTGAALNHLKAYPQSKAGNTVDWCATSTYIVAGFSDGTLRTYEHNATKDIITQKTSETLTGAINSVNWKYNASEIAVARAVTAANEFQIYSFNTSSYYFAQKYTIALTTDAYCTRYYYNTTTKSSYLARGDNTTRLLIVYKENYSPFIFKDVNLFLNGDLTLSSPLTFLGNCIINAQNNRITFTSDGALNIAPSSSLKVSLADLKFTTPSSFSLQGGSSALTLDNSKIEMNADMYLAAGSMNILNDLTITGPHNFFYNTSFTTTINSNTSFNLENGAILNIGKPSRSNIEQLFFVDNSSSLNLNNATINLKNYGMDFKRGQMNVYGQSTINIDTTIDSKNTFSCGDGLSSGNDPSIIIQGGGSNLAISDGLFVLNPAISSTIIQFNGESQLSLKGTCSFDILKTTTFSNGWILNSPTITLDINRNANLLNSNTRYSVLDRSQDFYLTGTRHLTLQSIILDRNDQIIINPGIFARTINIKRYENKVTGAGGFSGALIFTDPNSTLTWDIAGPIGSGNIDLKGGRMRITKDSSLISNYSFIKTGTVDLTDTNLQLAPETVEWDGNIYWIGNGGKLTLNSDAALTGIWTVSGSLLIDGQGYELDFESSGTLILERGARVTFKNIKLENISRQNGLVCLDDNAEVKLMDSMLALGGDYLFSKGALEFINNNKIVSANDHESFYTFTYDSKMSSTIYENSTLSIADGVKFSVGRKDSTKHDPTQQPIIFSNAGSTILLDGGTLHITSSGLIMTTGTMEVQNASNLEIDNTKYDYALVFGDGVQADDLMLKIDSGSLLHVKTGRLYYNNFLNNRIQFSSQESTIKFDQANMLYAIRSIFLDSGAIETSLSSISPTESAENRYVIYNDIHRFSADREMDCYATGTVGGLDLTLDSNDQISIVQNTLNRNIYVVGENNKISGVGTLNGSITFQDANSTLTWENLSQLGNADITLNGGRIRLTQDANFIHDHALKTTGTLDLTTKSITLSPEASTWESDIYWVGDGGRIILNNNVTIDGTWTLSGDITVEGNNFLIDLQTTGSIILERGANVTFKDMSIYNLSRQTPITCKDNNCQINLNIADLFLSGDYLFDKGAIYFYYNSRIGQVTGEFDTQYTFSYATTKTSTIDSDAYLKIDKGTRFSIGRRNSLITDPTQQPLIFNDPETAILLLDGGTLHVTSSGMIMTYGTLQADNLSSVEVENPTYPYGLILGDGTNIDNDFALSIGGGNQLALQYGSIFYNNLSRDRFVFGSPAGSLLINDDGKFMAMKDVTIQNGTVETNNPSNVAIYKAAGVNAIQSNITRIYRNPYSLQKRKVHEIRPYILEDSDYYYIQDGLTTNEVIARSGTSVFGGQGIFAGNISLHSPAATMNYYLTSPLASNLQLNGGTIVYYSNGEFGAEKTLTGSGNVKFIGTSLAMCPKTDLYLTHTIKWSGQNNGGIELYGEKTILSGTWSFENEMVICGNGNVLDLSQGGKLTLRPNSVLSIENISLKGLGQGLGSINFMDDTATLRLSNVYLELDNNMSTTIGGIIVNGQSYVGLKNYDWTLDTLASMTVNGVTLWQDPLDQETHGKIKFGTGSIGKYLSLVSSGTIKTATNADTITINSDEIVDLAKTTSSAVVSLAEHFISVDNGKFVVLGGVNGTTRVPGVGAVSTPINLNGGTLTLSGDLSLANQTAINSAGNLELRNNAIILGGDLTIPSGVSLKITSSGVLDGRGNNLDIRIGGKLIIDSNVTLTLRNINLLGEGSDQVEMRAESSKLGIQDSLLKFDRNFTFSQGQVYFSGDVMVTGTSKFSYASTSTSYILPHSTLNFDNNSTFSYSPRLTGRHAMSERDLISMVDRTSQIMFNGCTLQLPDSGWMLTKGAIYFDNLVTFYGNTSVTTPFVWGDGTAVGELDVNVLPSARFYSNVAMPYNPQF